VTVGAFATAINGLVIPAMRALRERRHGVRLYVRDMEADSAVDGLMAGEIDVALWLAWPGSRRLEERGAVGRPLFDDVLDVVLPVDHPWAGRRAVPLAALRDASWVAGGPGSPCRLIYEAACAAAGFTPRVEHCSDDWSVVVGLVAAGAGVALVPRLAQPAVTGDVVVRPVAGTVPQRHIALVTRPAAAAAPHISAVVDQLVLAADSLSGRVAA
jgi:DNA-binding transcriptional LysR family regulator